MSCVPGCEVLCVRRATARVTIAKSKIGKASLILINIIKQEIETKDKVGKGERTMKCQRNPQKMERLDPLSALIKLFTVALKT